MKELKSESPIPFPFDQELRLSDHIDPNKIPTLMEPSTVDIAFDETTQASIRLYQPFAIGENDGNGRSLVIGSPDKPVIAVIVISGTDKNLVDAKAVFTKEGESRELTGIPLPAQLNNVKIDMWKKSPEDDATPLLIPTKDYSEAIGELGFVFSKKASHTENSVTIGN